MCKYSYLHRNFVIDIVKDRRHLLLFAYLMQKYIDFRIFPVYIVALKGVHLSAIQKQCIYAVF